MIVILILAGKQGIGAHCRSFGRALPPNAAEAVADERTDG
jgi:hypothetical protein